MAMNGEIIETFYEKILEFKELYFGRSLERPVVISRRN